MRSLLTIFLLVVISAGWMISQNALAGNHWILVPPSGEVVLYLEPSKSSAVTLAFQGKDYEKVKKVRVLHQGRPTDLVRASLLLSEGVGVKRVRFYYHKAKPGSSFQLEATMDKRVFILGTIQVMQKKPKVKPRVRVVKPNPVRLMAGDNPAEMELHGTGLDQLGEIKVLYQGQATSRVKVYLGTGPSAELRRAKVAADAGTPPGAGYVIQAQMGKKWRNLPVRVLVVAPKVAKDTKPKKDGDADVEPQSKKKEVADGTDKQDEKNGGKKPKTRVSEDIERDSEKTNPKAAIEKLRRCIIDATGKDPAKERLIGTEKKAASTCLTQNETELALAPEIAWQETMDHCSARKKKVLSFLKALGSDSNKLSISKAIQTNGQPWNCAADPDSPNLILAGPRHECDESTIQFFMNGGASSMSHGDKLYRMGDANKSSPTDVWWKWRHKKKGSQYYHLARYCSDLGSDYPQGQAYIDPDKNQLLQPDGSPKEVLAEKQRESLQKMIDLYKDSSGDTGHWLALLASHDNRCDDLKLYAYTGFASRKRFADRYDGGKPFGGSNNVFHELSYVGGGADNNSLYFTTTWNRLSITEDNFDTPVHNKFISWVKQKLDLVGTHRGIWAGWDIQMKLRIRLHYYDANTYGIWVHRNYRARKHDDAWSNKLNGASGSGIVHAFFVMHIIDTTDSNPSPKVLAQINRSQLSKCPEQLQGTDTSIDTILEIAVDPTRVRIPDPRFNN